MSQLSRAVTGKSRDQMDSNNRREYESDNPRTDLFEMARSSKASDIFRDHGFEESLNVPQDQLKRLSFHDLNQADPSDVPRPLNIRKTPTPSNTPRIQEYNSVEDSASLPSEYPHVRDRFEAYPSTSHHAFEGTRGFTVAAPPSLSEQQRTHIPDSMASVRTENQLQNEDRNPPSSETRRLVPGPLTGDVFLASQIRRMMRDENEEFPDSAETNQSPPLRDGVARSLPRQQPIPVPDDPDIPDCESVASFDTIAQEHYRHILARRALLGLRRPKGIGFAANFESRGYQVDDENGENELVRRPNQDEHADVVRDHNVSGYLGKLHDQYGPIIPGSDQLVHSERPPSSIDSQSMTREEAMFARYALNLRPPSSNFSFPLQDNPGPATSLRGRHTNIDTNELDSEPCTDIVGSYRWRQARREAELYGTGDDESDDREILDESEEEVAIPEADNISTSGEASIYPGTARLRPNLKPFPPTRIPRPIQCTLQSHNLRNEQNVSKGDDVELGVLPEDLNAGEDVPALAKAKEDEAKGKAPTKKSKGAEQYDADPWSLMITGASTPHRAQKKNKKKPETESESHSLKFTPSSRHSKSSKYSDQPSSSSDKPGRSAKRGLAKPSPIKSVFRVASGILPKFLHSPSPRSQLSTSESHKGPDTNTNRNSDNNNTQEEHQQHRITIASSSSSGTRPSTRLRSLTTTSPTPFRACSRPELGFPSSPRHHSRGQQSSFFSTLPRSGPAYSAMEPPNRPPPPIPTQFRRTDSDAQVTSNEVATAEDTSQSSTAAHDVEKTDIAEDDPMSTSEPSATVPQTFSTQPTPSEVATEDMTAEVSTDEVATADDIHQQLAATQLDTGETATPGVTHEDSAFAPQAPSAQYTSDKVSAEDVNNEAFIDDVSTGDPAPYEAPATQHDSEEAFPCITPSEPSTSVPQTTSTQSTPTEVATERITTEAGIDAASSTSATTRAAPTEMTRTAVALAPEATTSQLDTDEGNSSETVPQVTSAEDSAPATSQAPPEANATEPPPVEVSTTQTTSRSSSSSSSNESTSTDDDWSTINSEDTEEEEYSPGQSSRSGGSSEEGEDEDEDSASGSSPSGFSGSGGVAPGDGDGDGEGDGEDGDADSGAVGSASETLVGGDNVPPGPERTESGGKVDDSELELPQVAQDLYEAVDVVLPVDKLASYREEFGCQYVEWTPEEVLPMRPDDKRVWYSNNLRCEDCAPNCCVCGRPCCVWNAAEQVLGDDLASEKEKQRALKLMQKLQRVLPVGEEPRTHVLCSSPGGCGLYACPYCAGRCPTTMCRDIQCLNCKEDPWGPCDWHPLD